jgi:hypothetical protein
MTRDAGAAGNGGAALKWGGSGQLGVTLMLLQVISISSRSSYTTMSCTKVLEVTGRRLHLLQRSIEER